MKMRQGRKQAPAGVEERLLTTLRNWVESVFFSTLIKKMEQSGIKKGSITAKVISANLLHHKVKKSFSILASFPHTPAHLYDAKATLTSSWKLATPSGTVHRIIRFEVKAEICLADWEGVTDFGVESIVVEGSDLVFVTLKGVVFRKVDRSDISTWGKKALSSLVFSDTVQEIAYFILLHISPPLFNFLSQKIAEIENALIHTLTTLPPLRVDIVGDIYTYRVKEVSRRAIKIYGCSLLLATYDEVRGEWVERPEDILKVIVDGILEREKNGEVSDVAIRVAVRIAIIEWDSLNRDVSLRCEMGIVVVLGGEREIRSFLRTLPEFPTVLQMRVEKNIAGVERFFDKAVEALSSGEIEKLIRKAIESSR